MYNNKRLELVKRLTNILNAASAIIMAIAGAYTIVVLNPVIPIPARILLGGLAILYLMVRFEQGDLVG
jgi:hypothetical protein